MNALTAALAGISARVIWRQAYRMARRTPIDVDGKNLKTGAALTSAERKADADFRDAEFPYLVKNLARSAAWLGKNKEPMAYPVTVRRIFHRSGCNVLHTLLGTSDRTVRLPR
jgi:hypothetical protein